MTFLRKQDENKPKQIKNKSKTRQNMPILMTFFLGMRTSPSIILATPLPMVSSPKLPCKGAPNVPETAATLLIHPRLWGSQAFLEHLEHLSKATMELTMGIRFKDEVQSKPRTINIPFWSFRPWPPTSGDIRVFPLLYFPPPLLFSTTFAPQVKI